MTTTTTTNHPDDFHWSTADRVTKVLRESGLSNAEIAARMGISPRTLSNWSSPTGSKPSIADLRELARLTGVPEHRLLLGYVKPKAGRRPGDQARPASP